MPSFHLELTNGTSTRVTSDAPTFTRDGFSLRFDRGDLPVLWIDREHVLYVKRMAD